MVGYFDGRLFRSPPLPSCKTLRTDHQKPLRWAFGRPPRLVSGPGVAIIDFSLSGRLSFDVTEGLRGEYPRTDLLVFLVRKETVSAEQARRVGAAGYLEKRAPTAEVLRAVRRVAEGRVYLSSEMNMRILERAKFNR